MRSHSVTVALSDADRIEKEATARLRRARELLDDKLSRALFIRDRIGHCDFAGYLLATVVERENNAAICIRDGEKWGLELTVRDVPAAEKIFDELFITRPDFDTAFEQKLRLNGFVDL